MSNHAVVRTEGAEEENKGRTFEATMLVMANSPLLMDGAANRPSLLMVMAGEEEMRAVYANLRNGNKATFCGPMTYWKHTALEMPKSAGYDASWSFVETKHGRAAVVTFFVNRLYIFTPGMVESDVIKFALMPAEDDLRELHKLNEDAVEEALTYVESLGYGTMVKRDRSYHERRWRMNDADIKAMEDRESYLLPERHKLDETLATLGLMWAEYIDRRCRWPIPQGAPFRLQLFLASLRAGFASLDQPRTGKGEGIGQKAEYICYIAESGRDNGARVAIHPGVITHTQDDLFRDLLSDQVQIFEKRRRPGRHRKGFG